ncbi:hypothetical protein AAVH_26440 [Aphelenchoides avenae]|nr:hypothetical protein AAVH_26440 [Aphelenchus avenae]
MYVPSTLNGVSHTDCRKHSATTASLQSPAKSLTQPAQLFTQPPPVVCIVAAYRMGQPRRKRPRLLKVVFAARSMQRGVLAASRHLRMAADGQYTDVYVRPSLTKEQRDAEFKLREECRRLRAQGHRCSIRNGAVVMGN